MIPQPQPAVEPASPALPVTVDARRAVSRAIAVLAISMLLSLGSYAWDWADVIIEGDLPERDEWLALCGAAWLPIVAVTVFRLVRVQRALTVAACDAATAFHDAAETAPGWVWRVGVDNRITYSSPGVRTVLGYEPAEVLGRDALELQVLEEDRAEAVARIRDGRAINGWKDWQSRVRHRDGSVRHVRSSATPILDQRGQLVAFQGHTLDVTAEVAAAAVEQAEQMRRYAGRMQIEQVLRDPDALQIMFQPIIDVPGQRITGMEALSRFAAEPYRPPNVWFDEAWQAGLGPDLELHAIALACDQLPRLPEGAYLSVNAAPQTILDDRFEQLLVGLGPDAARIVVEVTEHAAVADYEALAAAVQRLRRAGARIAVDDAGAGYASMQHILRLRPDIIKLDRGIVADIDQDIARRALVNAMAGFASSLQMAVVAEGVETGAELAVLADAGVPVAQGFLLARPSADPAPSGWQQSLPAG